MKPPRLSLNKHKRDHDDSDSDSDSSSDESNEPDDKKRPRFRGFGAFGALSLFNKMKKNRFEQKKSSSNVNVNLSAFQAFNRDVHTSWEDRVRTWFQTRTHHSINDSDWKLYLSKFQNNIHTFAETRSTFNQNGLITTRKWFEQILDSPISDNDFQMLVVDFYKTNNITYSSTDLNQISLAHVDGSVSKNVVLSTVPPVDHSLDDSADMQAYMQHSSMATKQESHSSSSNSFSSSSSSFAGAIEEDDD